MDNSRSECTPTPHLLEAMVVGQMPSIATSPASGQEQRWCKMSRPLQRRARAPLYPEKKISYSSTIRQAKVTDST